jgi:FdhD protein
MATCFVSAMPVNSGEDARGGAQPALEVDPRGSSTGSGPPESAALSEPATETHFRDGRAELRRAELAEEVPVAFEYNGVSHAVMLATPGDLEDFAVGFSVSEGIVEDPGEIYGVEAHRSARGIAVAIDIASEAFARLKSRRRTLAGRTGCGICGAESLDHVLRPLPDLGGRGPRIRPQAVSAALASLIGAQQLQKATGAVHGAAWCSVEGAAGIVREDVGRHNALDKLIGAVLRSRTNARPGFVVVTSRASVEMVQKAACIATTLVAVSAPTRLAARIAHDCGLTLVGFARGNDFSVYSHAWRIAPAATD